MLYRRAVEDTLPRTIENVRIRATIQRTIQQVSSLVGSVTSVRQKKKKTIKRKKTTTKRKPVKK